MWYIVVLCRIENSQTWPMALSLLARTQKWGWQSYPLCCANGSNGSYHESCQGHQWKFQFSLHVKVEMLQKNMTPKRASDSKPNASKLRKQGAPWSHKNIEISNLSRTLSWMPMANDICARMQCAIWKTNEDKRPFRSSPKSYLHRTRIPPAQKGRLAGDYGIFHIFSRFVP